MQSLLGILASILLALCVNSQGLPFSFDPMGTLGSSKKLYALAATGTQYLNLGVIGSGDTRVVCRYMLPATPPDAWFFGSRSSPLSATFSFSPGAGGGGGRSDYASTQRGIFTATIGVWYTVDKNRGTTTITSDGFSYSNLITSSSFEGVHPMFIFTLNNNGTVSSPLYKAVVQFVQVYTNDLIVVDAVAVPSGDTQYSSTPAPSNCMFDNVSKTYFVNQGTGSFGIEEVK